MSLEYPDIVKKALHLMETGAAHLRFHNFTHVEMVLSGAVGLAQAEGRPTADQELLAIAASFHDIGVIQGLNGHEDRGAQQAIDAMREAGYAEGQIDAVAQMIRDTKVSASGPLQSPKHPLSKYLCDADVSGFGSPFFFENSKNLAEEIGIRCDTAYWVKCLEMLSRHEWQTSTARSLWEPQKSSNISELKALAKVP